MLLEGESRRCPKKRFGQDLEGDLMTLDFPQKRTDLRHGYRELGTALPDVMAGFSDMHRAAVADGELSRATKELIALAIGVAARCEGCIALHVSAALKAGATDGQVHEALGVAVLMGGGPASVYATEALVALEQFSAERRPTNVVAN
ncbi:MAG: AhpD family alkylhydroperoxidase [Ilumatobacter sp.]|jgi:AhpD family alkylhydroperoxidase